MNVLIFIEKWKTSGKDDCAAIGGWGGGEWM